MNAQLPNVLTAIRLALVPIMAAFVAAGRHDIAAPIFLVAALTDLADGYIARRFGLASRLGAALDPVADKLSMLVATLLLGWQLLIPWWLAAAIVTRDVLIVAGVLAYRAVFGPLRIAPTLLSKVNTALEFGALLLGMALGAHWIDAHEWLLLVFTIVLATAVLSGLQYAWIGGRRALQGGGE